MSQHDQHQNCIMKVFFPHINWHSRRSLLISRLWIFYVIFYEEDKYSSPNISLSFKNAFGDLYVYCSAS